MIADFEHRLADVLGVRLPPTFAGHVAVEPGAGPLPHVLVGVQGIALLEDELGTRPRLVPGADDARRVVRLACTVGITVRATPGGGRAEELSGLDAVLYAADAPDLRDGSALRPDAGDPGFLIDTLRIADSAAAPGAPHGTVPQATLAAQGWFWPVGTPGQTGVRIAELRLRGVALPIDVVPAPAPVAGGPAVPISLRMRPMEPLRLRAAPPVAPLVPFGRLAVSVIGPGGRPAAGTLAGGAAGTDGSRLLDLVDGVATASYTPPAAPAVDQLVVGLDDGAGGQGIELARLPLRVRPA